MKDVSVSQILYTHQIWSLHLVKAVSRLAEMRSAYSMAYVMEAYQTMSANIVKMDSRYQNARTALVTRL